MHGHVAAFLADGRTVALGHHDHGLVAVFLGDVAEPLCARDDDRIAVAVVEHLGDFGARAFVVAVACGPFGFGIAVVRHGGHGGGDEDCEQ